MGRDEFSKKTKKILAERVGWLCSFPGCSRPTVGSRKDDHTKSINLGDAAHIHAASPKGPRYNAAMSSEQRKDISNGIWMCKTHANLIDKDFKEYTPEILRGWKANAERLSHENLKIPGNSYHRPEARTLISLGFKVIFYAYWLKIHGNNWSFEILGFLEGSHNDIRDFSSKFLLLNKNEKFIVIESEGDARTISKQPELLFEEKKYILNLTVDGAFNASDPDQIGIGLAVDNSNDIFLDKNGNLAMMSGVDLAIQNISSVLGLIKGEYILDTGIGSLVSFFYQKYKDDLDLLSRLIKLELIRLSLINDSNLRLGADDKPSLHFISKIENVSLSTSSLNNYRLEPLISLTWGNGKKWSGVIPIWINEKAEEILRG